MSSSSSESDDSKSAVAGQDFDQELCRWLTSRQQQLTFDWTRIYRDFFAEYSKTFARSKKAHFDSLPAHWTAEEKVVDGARAKWCNLLVMDALIYFLQHRQFDLSYRRTFNQQKVLSDCIMKELQRVHPEAFAHFVRHKTTLFRDASYDQEHNMETMVAASVFRPLLQVENIFHPWEDLATLQDSMLREPTSKSKRKFQMIIESLCSHQTLVFYNHDIGDVLAAAIFKAIFVFPLVPGGFCFGLHTSSFQRFSRAAGNEDHLSSLRPIRRRIMVKQEQDTDEASSSATQFNVPLKVPLAKVHRREQSSPIGIETDFEIEAPQSKPSKPKQRDSSSESLTVLKPKMPSSSSSSSTIKPRGGKLVSRTKRRGAFALAVSLHEYEYGVEFAKKQKLLFDAHCEPDFELFTMMDDTLDSSLPFEDPVELKQKVRSSIIIEPSEAPPKEREHTLDSFFLDWLDDSSMSSDNVDVDTTPTKASASDLPIGNSSCEVDKDQKLLEPSKPKIVLKKRLPEYYEKNMAIVDVISSSRRFYDHLYNAQTMETLSSLASSSSSSPAIVKNNNVEDEDGCAEPAFSTK